jgi:hypothetical protein
MMDTGRDDFRSNKHKMLAWSDSSSSFSTSSSSEELDQFEPNDPGATPVLDSASSTGSGIKTVVEKLISLDHGWGSEDCNLSMTDVVNAARMANPAELDAILAKEMSQLSMTQRDHGLQEVHGVADKIVEDPVFIQERLAKLRVCLANIRHKDAYDRALYQSPEYVQDETSMLMFLRSEYFDPQLAAERLVRHFEQKLRLFGPDFLVQDITLNDLDTDDLKALYEGGTQVLPIRDRSDRAVLCFKPAISRSISNLSRVSVASLGF